MIFIEDLAIASQFNISNHPNPSLWLEGSNSYQIRFDCMASNCSILIECDHIDLVKSAAKKAIMEAWRIEHKFSRYRQDNTFTAIHSHANHWQALDHETAQLMIFASHAYQASEGLFDITSGILRRVWSFDGSDNLPQQSQIDDLLTHVGWEKLDWNLDTPEQLNIPEGMELDFGGIGKEYAVDRMLNICIRVLQDAPSAVLINCGGDLTCSGPRLNGESWKVGIESLSVDNKAERIIELSSGALATSGDSKRFLLKDGIRYSHVLNPRTGWPVKGAPRSITVAAPNCVNAGIIATLSLLQGNKADSFLSSLDMPYWINH
ncbi:FAD:protein FMN transferase [Marinomonas transparens]|uniref:FAD:protein FMN transferase n=1 Tax=Marinomonas transparens TaxID=2795388 RepID=A0A934JL19_9GAMM|nr:FAD:protein FMN transferase [Marinomonas transparens]MBJ7538110.1 FAD:protein FMN transferase [Marinomonas transparens]